MCIIVIVIHTLLKRMLVSHRYENDVQGPRMSLFEKIIIFVYYNNFMVYADCFCMTTSEIFAVC